MCDYILKKGGQFNDIILKHIFIVIVIQYNQSPNSKIWLHSEISKKYFQEVKQKKYKNKLKI